MFEKLLGFEGIWGILGEVNLVIVWLYIRIKDSICRREGISFFFLIKFYR